MNPILIILAAACTVLVYAAGVITGLLINARENHTAGRCRNPKSSDGIFAEPGFPSACPEADPVQQLRMEEDRKAFADCMSYSAERAYERNNQ